MRKREIEKLKWEYYRKFGAQVAKARKAKGLSQTALAEKVGLKRPFLAKIEQGRSALLLHVGEALKKALALGIVLSMLGCERPQDHTIDAMSLRACQKSVEVYRLEIANLQAQLDSKQRTKSAVE